MLISETTIAIGLGIFYGLLFAEVFGFVAGGLVVPGFLALMLNSPLHLVVFFLLGLVVMALVRFLSHYVLLYGRRRYGLMMLLGMILVSAVRQIGLPGASDPLSEFFGFILPGLMAHWFDRQGIVNTVSATVIVALLVKTTLVMIQGGIL